MAPKIIPAALLFAVSIPLTEAAVLARWTPVSVAFDPVIGATYNGGTETPAPDEVGSNLMVSPLDRIGGAEFGGANAGTAWPGLAIDGAPGITLTSYTSFSITPEVGFSFSLDTVTYNYRTYTQSQNGGYLLYLRSSADGFAADLATTEILASDPSTGLFSFDASGLTDVISATEFRIYASAPTGTGGSRWFDLGGDDTLTDVGLIVNGSVNTVIPEPSSLLLTGLAGLALTLRRRRQ